MTGCSSNVVKFEDMRSVKNYSNPVNGVVAEDSELFIKDIHECETKAFGDGIDIGGVKIKDSKILKKIFRDGLHNNSYSKNNSIYKARSKDEVKTMAMHYIANAPKYNLEIHGKMKIYGKCLFSEKDYDLERSTVYHKDTGEKLQCDEKWVCRTKEK